jgi:zinicin-like metallopeptidase
VELSDFRSLVDRLRQEVPASYVDGVVEIAVSPKTIPHPLQADVYTLGECIPLEWTSGADLQSRVVLYYGSFRALARRDEGAFDWRAEVWETLTHELRHHLEWRASLADLEAYDWAAEQNFARHEGKPFDPVFYRNGEMVAEGVTKVDDDVFIETDGKRVTGGQQEVVWHGRRYRVRVPSASRRATVFLTLEGLADPPPGDAVLVRPGRTSIWSLFRSPAAPVQVSVTAEPLVA